MGRHTAPQRSKTALAAVVVPVLATAGLAAGIYALRGHDGGSAVAAQTSTGDCTPTHVRVTTPVEMAPTVRALTEGLAKKGATCVAFDITEQDAQTTARAIATGASTPQIWVTDSPMWVERVNHNRKETALEAGPTIATSPIGIAIPAALSSVVPSGRQSLTKLFATAGGKLPMKVADLDTSSASLIGTTVAMGTTGKDQAASLGLARTMVGISQSWSTDAQLQLQAGKQSKDVVLFPASEQQMHALNTTMPQTPITAISFVEGDPTLDYRIVPVPGADAPKPEHLKAFTDALTGTDGVAKLTAAGFRVGDSTGPGVKGISGEAAKPVPLTLEQVDTAVRVTDAVSLDMNLLAVIDATGSMKDPAIGSLNRAQVATAAVQKAVTLFPEQTRFGLWRFAAGINGPGKPNYQQMLPIQPLSTKVGPTTQKNAALAALAKIPTQLNGATPLYDTILAAYKTAQSKAGGNQNSAMVLVTDGRNEAPGLTLEAMLAQLKAAQDPKRPVKVILVGIGQEADMPTLRRIARETGGAAYNATNPADIGNVVFDALAQRMTAATEL